MKYPISLLEITKKTKLISDQALAPYLNFSDQELFKILLDNFNLNEEELLKAITKELCLPFKKIAEIVIDQEFFHSFNLTICKTDRFLPIYQDQKAIYLAFDNPYNPKIKELKTEFEKEIDLVITTAHDLNTGLGIRKKVNHQEPSVLDNLLQIAIEKNASDIHLKKVKEKTLIDFRINGQIYPFASFEKEEEKRLLSLIKLNSGLDISQVNLPQDGRLNFTKDSLLFDIRVASLPTTFGENFVLRFFNESSTQFSLEKLGFSKENLLLIKAMLEQNHGLILVNGATGSGKTTTLYALIKEILKNHKKNIISLEDPVEHIIEGISQSQINSSIKYNFAQGLRAILRQDPDVIMIGEIRDHETAKIALEAAYTGHLVLASLHTADVASCLLRLANFQLDPFLVAYSLKGIIAQKLVSKLCDNCKVEIKSNFADNFYQEKGCDKCSYQGFIGRTVLAEIFDLTKIKAQNQQNLLSLKTEANFLSFTDDLKAKVASGIISENTAQTCRKNLD
ncbi:MAG: GspE/PulE family protein [Candidatus Margulisiibacteriota bacterium]|jgi:type II secretory ATPase GspE/PulE/Tfp pilus assembly ATPase PilB-like protein